MIFKRNKTTPTSNRTCQKGHLPLSLSTGFAVKSGVKSGATDLDLNRFSLDTLSHSKGTLDDTLNSDLFYKNQ